MFPARAESADQRQAREQTNLDGCYGRIGISALAAALRFRSKAKSGKAKSGIDRPAVAPTD